MAKKIFKDNEFDKKNINSENETENINDASDISSGNKKDCCDYIDLKKEEINLSKKDNNLYTQDRFLKALRRSFVKRAFDYNYQRKNINPLESENKNSDISAKKKSQYINLENLENNNSQKKEECNVFSKLKKFNEIKSSINDLDKKQDNQLKDLSKKTQRILNYEHFEKDRLKEIKTDLMLNKVELDEIYNKVGDISKINPKTLEIDSLKEMIKNQIEIINHRLSSLDHKEEAISNKINKIDEISNSLKGIINNVNELIIEKSEREFRNQKLNEKVDHESKILRQRILERERDLRELKKVFDDNKNKLSYEERIIAENKLNDMKSKIENYKKFAPKFEEQKKESENFLLIKKNSNLNKTSNNENLKNKSDYDEKSLVNKHYLELPKFNESPHILEDKPKNHDLFDESKLKERYSNKNNNSTDNFGNLNTKNSNENVEINLFKQNNNHVANVYPNKNSKQNNIEKKKKNPIADFIRKFL